MKTNPNLLKIDKKSHKSFVNPLYFIVGKPNGHIEEKNGNKYLVFDSTDKNKEELEKCRTLGWN